MKALPRFVPLLALLLLVPSGALGVDLIQVNGKAERKVAPDVAYLAIDVWSDGKTARAAQESSAREYARAEGALTRDFHVSSKSIRTESISLTPQYRYPAQGKPVLAGYTSHHRIEVTLHNLNDAGKIVDALAGNTPESEARGVSIEGIRFGTEKAETYETELLGEAVKNARAKADALASATGRAIRAVRSITQAPSAGIVFPAAAGPTFQARAVPTQIPAGEITVSAEVTVAFEF